MIIESTRTTLGRRPPRARPPTAPKPPRPATPHRSPTTPSSRSAACSPPSRCRTSGSTSPGRSSPTSAPGCSGSPRTGWCCSCPAAPASPSASPPRCSSCRCCCCPPYGGLVADRFAKRRLLQITQAWMAVCAAHARRPGDHRRGDQAWHVYVIAFAFGLGTAFDNPARQAFVSEMVGGTSCRTRSVSTPRTSTPPGSSARRSPVWSSPPCRHRLGDPLQRRHLPAPSSPRC